MAEEDNSILGTGVTTRQVEAFGRKVTATANHLLGENTGTAYQSAMTNIHQTMRRPGLQQSVFSITRSSPRETLRARLSTNEIQHRALSYIPDDMLANLPVDEDSTYSLFQGFKATLPEDEGAEDESEHRKRHRRSGRGQRLLKNQEEEDETKMTGPQKLKKAKRQQGRANHRLDMLGIRKNMCSVEILEIDKKIANLQSMRKIVLERLADLEDDELKLEQDIAELDIRVEDIQDLVEEEEAASKVKADSIKASKVLVGKPDDPDADDTTTPGAVTPRTTDGTQVADGFMSESIYEKIPGSATSSKPRRQKLRKRKSMPIRHGHFEPGTSLLEIPAHNDMVTSLDFDTPFGTMVTAALDDTLRVWDLNSGRCLGLLEGHRASVRCLQVEDTLCATGSIDASVRLWDLSRIDAPSLSDSGWTKTEDDADEDPSAASFVHEPPSPAATADCEILSLEAHVAEITALYMRGDTLVSGSADKTLRQWDLNKGRCVQTLDVLWAAAQSSSGAGGSAAAISSRGTDASTSQQWRTTSRLPDVNADFVGALQCFDAALACGTADGMVRLWDLRTGQVSRSLVGHTGPVTCLQFDDVHMVTGSLDRSIRIWDLRTGTIFDAFAYPEPVTSMMFDARRIVAAASEPVIKVYDKTDGHQWDCGAALAATTTSSAQESAGSKRSSASTVEQVRIRDGFMIAGRKDGTVGAWTC